MSPGPPTPASVYSNQPTPTSTYEPPVDLTPLGPISPEAMEKVCVLSLSTYLKSKLRIRFAITHGVLAALYLIPGAQCSN